MRLITPPVTHTGSVERVLKPSWSEIEDWQVRGLDGQVHGAYTQRAMFAIARRDGVKLPPGLREIERDGFQVLHQRVSLTPLRKLWLAWKMQALGKM